MSRREKYKSFAPIIRLDMAYKILIIEKAEEDFFGSYDTILALTSATRDLLHHRGGHRVDLRIGLDAAAEADYARSDCVLVHPPWDRLGLLRQWNKEYPTVGLIVFPGAGRRCERFHDLARDSEGIYILQKPFQPETLLSAIEKAVVEARLRAPRKVNVSSRVSMSSYKDGARRVSRREFV